MRKPSLGGLGQTCGIALPGALRNFPDKMEAELAPHRPIRAQHGMTYVTAPCIEACPSKGNVPRYNDCVRSAIRLGAEEVHVIYRRTVEDMPAEAEEITAAKAEGVAFHTLCNPTRILAENGRVVGLELARMQQSEPDDRGRRRAPPIPGSEFTLKGNTLIPAIGQQVEDGTLIEAGGIELDRWCNVAADTALATSRPGVFAGGDCVTGASTLIYAMAAGLKAARNIEDWVERGSVRFFKRSRMRRLIAESCFLGSDVAETPVRNEYRVHNPELDPELRKHMFAEVEQTISVADAYADAQRCMRCYRIYAVVTQHPIPEGAA